MNGRPTYREYRISLAYGNMIMTPDGSFYAILNKWLNTFFRVLSAIAFIIGSLGPLIIFFNDLWLNLLSEFYFLIFFLPILLNYPKYLLLHFMKLEPGNCDYEKAARLFEPRQKKRKTSGKVLSTVGAIILASMFMFILLNSHTAQLVRSLFDSRPRLATYEVTNRQAGKDVEVLYSAGKENPQTVIYLPADDQNHIYVDIMVSRMLTPAQLSLDGETLSPNINLYSRQFSWFWESEYLKQDFFFYLEDIHDGSVLNLTCGDLHQEWVIEMADEEKL